MNRPIELCGQWSRDSAWSYCVPHSGLLTMLFQLLKPLLTWSTILLSLWGERGYSYVRFTKKDNAEDLDVPLSKLKVKLVSFLGAQLPPIVFLVFSSVAPHRGQPAAKCHPRWQTTRRLTDSCGLGRRRIRTQWLQDNSLAFYHWVTTPQY